VANLDVGKIEGPFFVGFHSQSAEKWQPYLANGNPFNNLILHIMLSTRG
jgi:hypothetical protein